MAGAIGVPSHADAAAPAVRYDRESKKAKAKSELLDTKFKKAKDDEDKKNRRGVQMMSGDEFAKKRKAVQQEIADKQIDFLKRLVKSTPKNDPEYADYLFRLADHYLEKKAYFDIQSGALYDKIYDREDAGDEPGAKKVRDKQAQLLAKSRESSKTAARVYKALVMDPANQTYKRMDEALYYYAFELGQLDLETDMQDAYKRLINNYPNSSFISQAYLAFADYYYGKGEIQNAVRLYTKVLQFKGSPVYAYAHYKLGWCHLNPIGTADPEYDKSLNYFIETIRDTLEGRAGSEAAGRQLRRDARRDLVRAYTFVGSSSKAWPFFQKWGRGPGDDEDDARKMMEILANSYFGNGLYTPSTYIYKQLQEIYEGDHATCDWQGRIVVNTLSSDNKEIQWKETKHLGAYWERFRDGEYKKTVKKKCRDDALDTMKQMATVWHDEAEKTNIDRTYELAEVAYAEFLKVFPKDKDAYELQFYYSELLWALATNNYSDKTSAGRKRGIEYFFKAHDEFVNTLEFDPKGKYTVDSAIAQMLAMKNALEYDETGGQAKACKTDAEGVCIYKEKKKRKKIKASKDSKVDAQAMFPASDYTDTESRMLDAYNTYTKYVTDPNDKELPKIMYHRAKLAMNHNKFETARPLLIDLLEKFDGSIYAAWSSEMFLDLLTINWTDKDNLPEQSLAASAELEAWCQRFPTMQVWKHAEAEQIRESVPTLLMGIGWKKAMTYQDSGKRFVEGEVGGAADGFAKCAEQFLTVFNDFEDHPKADTLLWNSAECLDAAYKVGNSIKVRKTLLELFPESKHAQESLYFLGGSYQAIAYYDQAAQRYEQFAEKYPKDKRSPDALQNAYLFQLGLGNDERAETNLKKYEAIYKKKDVDRAARIFWSKHALIEEDDAKRAHATEYLKTYGTRGGKDRAAVAEAEIAIIDWKRSCKEELLYDSCMSVKRERALSAAEEIEKKRRMEAKLKRAVAAEKRRNKKKDGKDDEDDSKKKKKKYIPPQRCGSATQGVITVHERDKKLATAAQKRFKKIEAIARKGPKVPAAEVQRVEAFKNAWGAALVYRADREYEEYLQTTMPEGLDFNVEEYKKESPIKEWAEEYEQQVKTAEESKKRFSDYFEKKSKSLLSLTEQYAKVKATGSPYWILAASARTALLSQNFADELYRAEVPRSFKTEDQYYAYCDALAIQAEPLEKQAVSAFDYCIGRSTEFQFFNTFSRLCEEEMQQRDAEKFPATNEQFGESTYTESRIATVGVMTSTEGVRRNRVKQNKKSEGEAEGESTADPKKMSGGTQ